MNDNNNDGKRQDSYDRRPVVDTPQAKKNASHAVSVKRKGFYIILLLGITAIGIYAIISSLTASSTVKKDKNESHSAAQAVSTARPKNESVPVNADTRPVDESEPMTADEINGINESKEGSEATPAKADIKTKGQPPVSGKVIKEFSDTELIYSSTMKDWRTHAGIDIAANQDTPVTAIKDGTLKKVYEDSLFGTTVVIHHDEDGTDSVYSNLKDATKDPIGTPVKMGDVIGKIGKTAVSETEDESHLHFEIKLGDTFLSPREFIEIEEVDYLPEETDSTAAMGSGTVASPSLAPSASAPSGSAEPFETAAPYDYGAEDEAAIYID